MDVFHENICIPLLSIVKYTTICGMFLENFYILQVIFSGFYKRNKYSNLSFYPKILILYQFC